MSDARTDLSPALDREAGSHCLEGERLAFTGTLASMTHRQAYELTEQYGGVATTDVSRQTTMLIVGEEGWPLEPDGKPSQKWQHADEFQRDGVEVQILNESQWLEILGISEQQQEIHRLYTPAMLGQLLGVPTGTVRSWERSGLIKAVRKVYRLPYFDFQEVSGARKITELLAAGVSRSELEASFESLRTVLGGVDRPLAQLEVLAGGSRLLVRDNSGLLEPRSGQRCFDFEPPVSTDEGPATEPEALSGNDVRMHWSADEWFSHGCRHLEDNEPQAAVEAFRMCLMEVPADAETNFFLAEALYRSGNAPGALERYYSAVECDHEYLEAWTQIGCLHAECGDFDAALEAFHVAIDVHNDYPDAHWQAASVLDRLGRSEEAVAHWRKYLEFDSRGPWAEEARQRIEDVASPK